MPDDLGNRPVVEASLLPLADELDAKARAAAIATADLRRGANAAIKACAFEMAATLYEQILAEYVRAGIGGYLVDDLRRRVVDCRNARDLQKRRGKR
jgi:hypothetical protein